MAPLPLYPLPERVGVGTIPGVRGRQPPRLFSALCAKPSFAVDFSSSQKPDRLPSVSCAAVPGTTIPRTRVRPTATGTRPPNGTTTTASVLPVLPVRPAARATFFTENAGEFRGVQGRPGDSSKPPPSCRLVRDGGGPPARVGRNNRRALRRMFSCVHGMVQCASLIAPYRLLQPTDCVISQTLLP